jgi:2-amino-4-hydroxy-6-hydroxymethyldihydropteridine diphosphokinase
MASSAGVAPVVVYVAIGSNLSNPQEQVRLGIKAVAALAGCRMVKFSGLYGSPPMGRKDQPDYVNAVMAVETIFSPMQLLGELQAIEIRHGRVKVERWGARTLDLDLLLYGEERIEVPELTVPHVGIAERAFVLYPLSEIAPHVTIPGKGKVSVLLQQCPRSRLDRIA